MTTNRGTSSPRQNMGTGALVIFGLGALFVLVMVIYIADLREQQRSEARISSERIENIRVWVVEFNRREGRFPYDLHELYDWLQKNRFPVGPEHRLRVDDFGNAIIYRYEPTLPKDYPFPAYDDDHAGCRPSCVWVYSVGPNGIDELGQGDDIKPRQGDRRGMIPGVKVEK